MRSELLRRAVSFGHYGIDFFGLLDGPHETLPTPHVLIIATHADDDRLIRIELGDLTANLRTVKPSEALAALAEQDCDAAILIEGRVERDAIRELCGDMRRNPRLFHLPVLYIVPSATPDAIAQAYRNGASEVLRPPLESHALQTRLAIAVRHGQLRGRMLAAYRQRGQLETNDPATGLFTAEFLNQHVGLLIEDATRWEHNLAVIICSVPAIGRLARQQSPEMAHGLRRQLGSVVARLVRGEDMVACLGDETFCIVMPESGIEATAIIMHRLAGVVGNTEFALGEPAVPITVHPRVGSAEFKRGDTIDSLLGRAQAAAMGQNAA
jgi:two-component system cell cycle response regulator